MHSVHRVVFVLLLDLLAHEMVHLVGITTALILTSPVKDLEKKKHQDTHASKTWEKDPV